MHLALMIIKYVFVVVIGIEVVLILRSLILLARDRARAATAKE